MRDKLKLILLFGGISLLLTIVFRVPTKTFLEYDVKDIFLALSGTILGAHIASILTIIVTTLETITVSFSGQIGFIFNLTSSLAFVCLLSYIHNKNQSFKRLILSCIVSSFICIIVMIAYNCTIFTIMGYSKKEVIYSIFENVIPFNLIKTFVNSLLIILLYNPLKKMLKKYKLLKNNIKFNYKLNNLVITLSFFIITILPIVISKKTNL